MSLYSGIARTVDQAPWKKPEQLVARNESQALHEQTHGQVLPVFMGAVPVEGVVFWRDGPHINTDGRVIASFAVAHSFNQFQRPGEPLTVEFDDLVVFDAIEGWHGGVDLDLWITVPQTSPPPRAGTRVQRTHPDIRVYDGIDNDFEPTMLAKDGAALTPAYHGLRYLFFKNVDLTPFDGAIPASIRILWGDTVASSGTSGTIPLIATAALGYSLNGNTSLCYDQSRNRFYTWYGKSGDAGGVHIGTTDFTAGTEVNLVRMSAAPDADIGNIWGACAIPGTGLMLCVGNIGQASNNWDLLIDVETGVVVASSEDGVDQEVEWFCALPLIGGSSSTYIAAGRVTLSNDNFNTYAAFAAINASDPAIDYLLFGSNDAGSGGDTLITPGSASAEGTTFYTADRASGEISEALFTDLAPPVWRLVYDAGTAVTGLFYDAAIDALVVSTVTGSTREVRRIDPATGVVGWTVTVDGNASAGYSVMPGGGAYYSTDFAQGDAITHRLRPGFAILRDINGGVVNEVARLVDLSDGSTEDLGTLDSALLDHYDQFTGTIYRLTTDEWLYAATTLLEPGTVTLADELTTFSTYDDNRGGLLTDSQVTTEGLDGIVNGGVIIDSDTDLRELAGRLAELYGVVKVETATGVKWVKKATDGDYVPDVTLTESDLVAERRGDAVVRIATRDRNPKEIPAEVEVSYISSDADYEPMPARAAWPQGVYDTALSLLKRSLSVPVVLTDQQALELAWGLLARERAATKVHSLTLRPNRLKLEPSDVFELTVAGQTIVGMFTKQTLLPDHSLEMTAEGYLSRAATTVTAESPIVHAQPTPSFNTLHVFLDGPLLRYSHDGGGDQLVGYSVLTGLEGWQGGSLYMRRAGETTWTRVADIAGERPLVGVLTAPLPASPWPFETDAVNDLTFRVVYGESDDIAAQTEAQFYEAASVIAVGAPGRWNFVTYRNKTVNADGTITLDTLRQGLKGTEVHEGTSVAGDRVVLVKANQALLVPYELGDVGGTVDIKAVALGGDPNGVVASRFTVSGAAETPRAPGNLDAAVDGSDVALTWDRRSRLLVDATGDFGDGDEAPLGADLDVYKVEILDGPGGSVVRTYSAVAGEAKTYAAADITADFGSMPSTLTFRVSQKTSITEIGYGHAAERSVALS